MKSSTPPDSTAQYSGGYSSLVVEALVRRKLDAEARFFLPHLQPGMDLLDCGCGPGGLSIQLASRVSPGSVIGVDREDSQFERGRRRAEEEGVSNVRFEMGDVCDLQFEDATFDGVFAHAVFYHLPQPERAVAEAARVLKPGGVFAIRDADGGGDIWAPPDEGAEQAWELMGRVLAYRGAHRDFGRRHRQVLREAGLERIEASASYDAFGTSERVQLWARYCSYYLTELHAGLIVEQGWASESEVADHARAIERWAAQPDAFYARCRCEAVAYKPE